MDLIIFSHLKEVTWENETAPYKTSSLASHAATKIMFSATIFYTDRHHFAKKSIKKRLPPDQMEAVTFMTSFLKHTIHNILPFSSLIISYLFFVTTLKINCCWKLPYFAVHSSLVVNCLCNIVICYAAFVSCCPQKIEHKTFLLFNAQNFVRTPPPTHVPYGKGNVPTAASCTRML